MKANHLIFLSLLIGMNANAQNLVACDIKAQIPHEIMNDDGDLEAFLKPVPTNIANCDKGIKLSIDVNTDVWRCRVDENSTTNKWQQAYLIFKNGKNIAAYQDMVMMGAYDIFANYQVDLDNDEQIENVLALWQTQSNGMGVNRWQINVFDKNWRKIGKSYDVEDWGKNAFVKGSNGCDIAITSWVEDKSRKQSGTAYQAKFISLKNGAFVPSKTNKTQSLRYTNKFEEIRNDFMSQEGNEHFGDPIGWFKK